jgi:hypothetical protein
MNMDNELRYFLQQGPHTVKDLARVTGKSTSAIYKALKDQPEVLCKKNDAGANVFWMKPDQQETPEDGAGGAKDAPSTPSPTDDVAVAPEPSSTKRGRGRLPTAHGKQLYPTAALLGTNDNEAEGATPTYQNPRRQNSHGYRSLQIIIDQPGITTEDFLAAGGRLNDLRWDLKHGHIRAE